MSPTYDAFEMHEHGPGNYGVTLVDTTTGARFTTNPVVCGRQAHYAATRGGRRAMAFLGVTKMSGGELVATTLPETCPVTDPGHVHTHRMAHPILAAPELADRLGPVLEAAAPAALTPYEAGRRARLTTGQAHRGLAWMVAHQFATVEGNGAHARYRHR